MTTLIVRGFAVHLAITRVGNPALAQSSSPAINAATGTRLGGIDLRGRGVDGAADIGAFEVESSNANSASLVLSDGTLAPVFSNGNFACTATVGSASASLIVTPTAENAAATITVNGTPFLSGAASDGIPLNFGAGNLVTMSSVLPQDAAYLQTIGQGLVKVLITAPVKGPLQTFGVQLGN